MAKKKTTSSSPESKIDFKKEWERTRSQLTKLSKEAAVLAKKSEREIVRFSKKGKLHVDSSAAYLKKEHLIHQIGKEYIRTKDSGDQSVKMKRLLTDLGKVDAQLRNIKSNLKQS